MRLTVIILILCTIATAKVVQYPPTFQETIDYRERISFPHIYPGQTITSQTRFLEEPMRPGTSTVKWTTLGSYSIELDKVHLDRKSYTLKIKSKKGYDLRMLSFETTKIYLPPEYYGIRFDKETNTIWLAKYSD